MNRQDVLPLPSFFRETDLGLSKGAIRQYRDGKPTNSLHLHEFPDFFLVHVDTFNAEFHPVAHGIVDTPGIALAVIGGAIATFLLCKSIDSISFLPAEPEKNSV